MDHFGKAVRRGCIVALALLVFAVPAQASERAISYKDLDTRWILAEQGFQSLVPRTGMFEQIEPTFNTTWCQDTTMTYWSNSRHPGYKHTPNQHQDGVGIKDRKSVV